MNFKSVFGLSYTYLALLFNTAWSWELVNFRPVKSDNGELLCGMSPPNKTQNSIGSKALCISSCFHVCPSRCQAVNYWKNSRLCQHFYYIPCTYDVQQDCISNQVSFIV